MATTTYTVAPGPQWPELVAWGPAGVEDGPSPLANHGRVHFITEADAAPVEYAPQGQRPFFGADLVVGQGSWWRFDGGTPETGLTYVDAVLGLRTVLRYEPVPDTDVLLRWVELTNNGDEPLAIERAGSAGFCLPTHGARATFLSGQWTREFQRQTVTLPDSQLALARIAADVGAELFVVDDGWFTGRGDDTGGLGDWTPDEHAFPDGFTTFVNEIRALGLDFGLWVEPEAVSPKSRLYQEHPDWVYRVDGRPLTLIRNQLLLNLGREDVREFVWTTLDSLLTEHPIGYLKWDMNRPATPRGLGLDGDHVANYLTLLDRLRAEHPDVLVEACAGGGGRTDLATIARSDVVWPSDNTAPLDRLSIQDGFLLAHAPHLMSSWVTDAPGIFDPRPRSLRFRFVLAMAGVLGIGADIARWTEGQRAEARELVALYKEIREIVHTGAVYRLPDAVQYVTPGTTVVLAWHTGRLTGVPEVPGRPARLPLQALAGSYVDRRSGARYSAAHLTHVGLPMSWTRDHDAEVVVLDHVAT